MMIAPLKDADDHHDESSTPLFTFPNDALVNHGLVFNSPKCNATLWSGCWRRDFPIVPLVLKTRALTSDMYVRTFYRSGYYCAISMGRF
jgi:hypothetical protein